MYYKSPGNKEAILRGQKEAGGAGGDTVIGGTVSLVKLQIRTKESERNPVMLSPLLECITGKDMMHERKFLTLLACI